jgi:hypothetical protein
MRLPQAMGSGPLVRPLFYQYKCTVECAGVAAVEGARGGGALLLLGWLSDSQLVVTALFLKLWPWRIAHQL